MSMQFQVFIGYDPRQPVAFHVAAHSLVTRASKPVPVTRLQLNQLPITRRGLTEFTYSRFLVPYLSNFEGYSLFLDSDFLVLADIWKLFDHVDPSAAVSVVMHGGQRAFERASLMLFNNKRCPLLVPEFVDDKSQKLMDLAWATKVAPLPKEWNHLVGYDSAQEADTAKILHYTKGVPCWPETKPVGCAEIWANELRALGHTVSFQELMGGSVHVPTMALPGRT